MAGGAGLGAEVAVAVGAGGLGLAVGQGRAVVVVDLLVIVEHRQVDAVVAAQVDLDVDGRGAEIAAGGGGLGEGGALDAGAVLKGEALAAHVQVDDGHRLEVVGSLDDQRRAQEHRGQGLVVGLALLEGLAHGDDVELGVIFDEAQGVAAGQGEEADQHLGALGLELGDGLAQRLGRGGDRDPLGGDAGLGRGAEADEADLEAAGLSQDGGGGPGGGAREVGGQQGAARFFLEFGQGGGAVGPVVGPGGPGGEARAGEGGGDGLGLPAVLRRLLAAQHGVEEEQGPGGGQQRGGGVGALRGDVGAQVVDAAELVLRAAAGLEGAGDAGGQVEAQRGRGGGGGRGRGARAAALAGRQRRGGGEGQGQEQGGEAGEVHAARWGKVIEPQAKARRSRSVTTAGALSVVPHVRGATY